MALSQLGNFVLCNMQQYFNMVEKRVEREQEGGAEDTVVLVRALDRFHRRLQAMNTLFSDTDFARYSKYLYNEYKDRFKILILMFFNPLNSELNPICKSQLARLLCGVFKFCACFLENLNISRTKWHIFVKQKEFCGEGNRHGSECLKNAVMSILHNREAKFLINTFKCPCSLTYIVVEALHGGWTKRCLVSCFLCGNMQNSFGPHKAPRHT